MQGNIPLYVWRHTYLDKILTDSANHGLLPILPSTNLLIRWNEPSALHKSPEE